MKAQGTAACTPLWKHKLAPLETRLILGEGIRQRTCISCKKIDDKQSMLRLYRKNDGRVAIDLKGNEPGRGAYICSSKCLERALDKNLIGRALRVKFENEFEVGEKEAIMRFFSCSRKKICEE